MPLILLPSQIQLSESCLLYILKHFPICAPLLQPPIPWMDAYHLSSRGSSWPPSSLPLTVVPPPPTAAPPRPHPVANSSHHVLSKAQICLYPPPPHLADSYSPHVQDQGSPFLGNPLCLPPTGWIRGSLLWVSQLPKHTYALEVGRAS